jgi:hypothetical protein
MINARAAKTTDPVQRFVEVCRFFLSGWHIKPKVPYITPIQQSIVH